MWFPHRMRRRRSHTLTLFRNGEDHLLSEKRHTQASPPPATEVLEGRATQGGARAREFLGPQGASKPAFGALCALEVQNVKNFGGRSPARLAGAVT
jgi:hypothetical protein